MRAVLVTELTAKALDEQAIRADERAKIVAFLREYAEPRDEGTWHINDAADRIERSEHLPEKK